MTAAPYHGIAWSLHIHYREELEWVRMVGSVDHNGDQDETIHQHVEPPASGAAFHFRV
jgi:hypothetical protein